MAGALTYPLRFVFHSAKLGTCLEWVALTEVTEGSLLIHTSFHFRQKKRNNKLNGDTKIKYAKSET